MVQFRRNYLPGGTYFFTVTLRNRSSTALVDYIDILRNSFRKVSSLNHFGIEAIVILPDHLHTIWTLPRKDANYPERWKAIKSDFTRGLRLRGFPVAKDKKGEYALWQRRYWEHTIRNEQDLTMHIDYIHYNPVKHGLVNCVKDWPYSSFHRFVERGILPAHWGGSVDKNKFCFGE